MESWMEMWRKNKEMGITSVSTSGVTLQDCSVPFYITAMKEILYRKFETENCKDKE